MILCEKYCYLNEKEDVTHKKKEEKNYKKIEKSKRKRLIQRDKYISRFEISLSRIQTAITFRTTNRCTAISVGGSTASSTFDELARQQGCRARLKREDSDWESTWRVGEAGTEWMNERNVRYDTENGSGAEDQRRYSVVVAQHFAATSALADARGLSEAVEPLSIRGRAANLASVARSRTLFILYDDIS